MKFGAYSSILEIKPLLNLVLTYNGNDILDSILHIWAFIDSIVHFWDFREYANSLYIECEQRYCHFRQHLTILLFKSY